MRLSKGAGIATVMVIISIITYLIIFLTFDKQSVFPPGGDIGHMIALSYTFDGIQVEGPLKYAPLFPFFIFVLRKSINDLALFLLALKLFNIGLLFGLGIIMMTVVKEIGESKWAGPIAYLLTIFNPFFFYQLLWGGYPQLLAQIFMLITIYWLIRIEKGYKYAVFFASLSASLVVAAHTYTAIHLLLYIASYFVFRLLLAKKSPLPRYMPRFLLLTTAFSLPYVQYYLNILHDLKKIPYVQKSIVFYIPPHSFPSLAILTILVSLAVFTSLVVERKLKPREDIEWLYTGSFFLSTALLMFFTPLEVIDRILYPLMLPTVMLISLEIPYLFSITTHRIRKLTIGISIVLLILFAGFSLHFLAYESERLYSGFKVWYLDSEMLQIFKDLANMLNPGEKVVVHSIWSNCDGWWFEAITAHPALITDSTKWYALQSEFDRAFLGKTILYGTYVIDGGLLRVLDNSAIRMPYRTPSILAVSDGEIYEILFFNDAYTRVVMHPRGNLSDTWIAVPYTSTTINVSLQSNSIISRYETDWYVVTKNISLDPLRDLISISYIFGSPKDVIIENATIAMYGGPGVVFEARESQANNILIRYLHEWSNTGGTFTINVVTDGTVLTDFKAKDEYSMSHLFISVKPLSTTSTLNVTILIKVSNTDITTAKAYTIYDIMKKENIRAIYLRFSDWWYDDFLVKKFETDHHFIEALNTRVGNNEVYVRVYKYADISNR